MRLKVYQAPNIGAAMAMVREELGPDALILGSRSSEDGVEVTAATEAAPSPSPLLPDPHREAAFRWHGTPAALAAKLATGDLTQALAQTFLFSSLPCQPSDPPLLLVGPPGAGKTMTTARLATRFKLAGKDAHVITADAKRAGAAEQLAAFTRLLGLTLIAADAPIQLARAVARRPEDSPTLIDMPGLNPAHAEDQDFLRQCHLAVGGTIALVLPAGLDPADAEDLALGFKELGATHLVITRLDQSRRLGGLLAAASVGLPFTEAGVGPGVADGLATVTADFITERLSGEKRPPPAEAPSSPEPVSALALLARARSELPRPPL